jgi:chloride channel 3/4/5
MIAAITLKLLDPFGTGKLVLFQVTYQAVRSHLYGSRTSDKSPEFQDWHAYELLPFILLGIFGVSADGLSFHDIDSSSTQGVYGAYFSKLNHYWSKHIRNQTFLRAHPLLEVLLVS